MRRLARRVPFTSRALAAAHRRGEPRLTSAPRLARRGRGAARGLVLVTLAATLLACPEERPGAAKEVPPQRVPPAMSLDAPPPAAERAIPPSLPGAAPAPVPAAGAPSERPPAAPSPAPAAPARRR